MADKRNSIFDLPEFEPLQARWQARLQEMERRMRYYDGSIYSPLYRHLLENQLGWLWPRLYKGVKPLYLPLARAVDVDAGIIPGEWTLPEDYVDLWQDAVKQVFDWSDWSRQGVLFIHYGAQYGLCGLKTVDLRAQRRVIIQPIKPTTFLLERRGSYDSSLAMGICVEERMAGRESYEYAEVITSDQVRTFYNGLPYGYEGREPEYANELGFVPIVEAQHINTGDEWGESTYQKAMPLLDEVNQLSSYLADIIGRHAEPQWVATGAESSELVKAGDNVWFLPSGADIKPLVAQVDFDGVLSFVQEVRDQVYGVLPELAFEELKQKTQIATATLELQLMELVLKVKRCRPNYDHGLADALRMAGLAGASMGLNEIASLADDSLTFDAKRPILPLDPLTEIDIETKRLALERMQALDNPPEMAPDTDPIEDVSDARPEGDQQSQDADQAGR